LALFVWERRDMRITYTERKVIERELKKGVPMTQIAKKLGVHRNTILYEVHRYGMNPKTYSAKTAQGV